MVFLYSPAVLVSKVIENVGKAKYGVTAYSIHCRQNSIGSVGIHALEEEDRRRTKELMGPNSKGFDDMVALLP